MARFEEFQELWQRQARIAAPPGDSAALKSAFRRYGRRHDLIYLGKALVIASQLIVLVVLLRHRPLAAFGACLAVFSAAYFLISDWRAQRAIGRLNFAEPSVPFLRDAIDRLQAQRDPFRRREFHIGWGGFWIGLNLMFASYWLDLKLSHALAAFAVTTVLPFGAFAQARRIRVRRFEKECLPLIDRLEAVLKTMENEPV